MEEQVTSLLGHWHLHRVSAFVGIACLLAVIKIGLWLFRSSPGEAQTSEKTSVSGTTRGRSQPEAPFLSEKPHTTPIETLPDRSITKTGPRRINGRPLRALKPEQRSNVESFGEIQPIVFFSSLGGTTQAYAGEFVAKSTERVLSQTPNREHCRIREPQLLDLSYIDYDDYFTALPKSAEPLSFFYIILIPSYDIDTNLNNFIQHLQETHHDFRVDTAPLSNILGYSVFGFGDRDGWPTEEDGFCYQAREVDIWLAKLTGRKRAYPLGLGDVKLDAGPRLEAWRTGVESVMEDLAAGRGLGEGVPGSGDAAESDEEEEDAEDADTDAKTVSKRSVRTSKTKKSSTLDDVENLGLSITKPASDPLPIDFTTSGKPPTTAPLKEMVPKTSPTYAALTKQGYSIIGSHSGVKICRWTKSALRGRGSCYKHSFYGIESHLCMEATPALSCSNKCVFCWRHGTNPVGTTWRWTTDPPELIFNGAKAAHVQKIRTLRGVPGVRAERFQDALTIRHCALSLVGEPIFYPRINELLALLHGDRISSFLVCNAQHPDQLATLSRVTQLYVSIDAADRDSLRRIDRPLHRDFWERFTRCLDILRTHRFTQRTVFRLTLVKGFNAADAAGYADLVARALPCFIEVKGVTYCGTSTSKGAGLSMGNVPFYEEVVAFVEALNAELSARGLGYGLAAEHAHSCCVLLASERFHRDGHWCTGIDYARFFELLESGNDFAPENYCARTPEWALWGQGGFDPRDERVKRRRGKVVVEDDDGAEAKSAPTVTASLD